MASDHTIKETAISALDASQAGGGDAEPQADMHLMSVALSPPHSQAALCYYHAPSDTIVNINPNATIGAIATSPNSLFFAGNLITGTADIPATQVRELIRMCLSKFDLRFMPHMDKPDGTGEQVVPMAIRTRPADADLIPDCFVHEFLVEVPAAPSTINSIIHDYEEQIRSVTAAGGAILPAASR